MAKNELRKKMVVDLIFLMTGCALLAFGIASILKPNQLVTGGVTGISVILDKVLNIKYTYL